MSALLLPALAGLGWSIQRTVIWGAADRQTNVSGTEVSKSLWSYPMYQWQVIYNVLRTGTLEGTAYTEMQQLLGFYNGRNGGTDSFLYTDGDDNKVTNQTIGLGDGTTTVFKLQRAFGSAASEPIYAPTLSLTFNVYLNDVLQSAANYTVTPWGTTNSNGPGCVIFNTAPGAGVRITASFSFYWPCRFVEDQCVFEKMMQGYYRVQKIAFQSIK